MNGLTFLELDYEINILKDSESLSLSVHLSFVISINHRIFVRLKRTVIKKSFRYLSQLIRFV